MPAITKIQLYKIEDRIRTDDGGMNRRVLLSSLTVHLDNLKGWEPDDLVGKRLIKLGTLFLSYVQRPAGLYPAHGFRR